eukprot:s1678_g7.t1
MRRRHSFMRRIFRTAAALPCLHGQRSTEKPTLIDHNNKLDRQTYRHSFNPPFPALAAVLPALLHTAQCQTHFSLMAGCGDR